MSAGRWAATAGRSRPSSRPPDAGPPPGPGSGRGPVVVDGSLGEGGGQVLRTALALSVITGRPLSLVSIRAGRPVPGLRPQHLACVTAAARIASAAVEGAEVGSGALFFRPAGCRPGPYRFDVGTAGSTSLVLQTVLMPLLLAPGPSSVVVGGGTHNPLAPPFEFLDEAFVPLLRRMGAEVVVGLRRHGFSPRGGGEIHAAIAAPADLEPLHLDRRGPMRGRRARALVVGLRAGVGERELAAVRRMLGWREVETEIVEGHGRSPGNAVILSVVYDQVTHVVTALGRRGLPAEEVARQAVIDMRAHLEGEEPVGDHLADQLLLPLAVGGGGSYVTGTPSRHTTTNIEVIRQFLDVDIRVTPVGDRRHRISVARQPS